MTTDTDRIEELAKWHDLEKDICHFLGEVWNHHDRSATFLHSLSAELIELRQAKESLDYLIKHIGFGDLGWYIHSSLKGMPPYLKSRLGEKK